MSKDNNNYYIRGILSLIILAALVLRFWGIDFGLPGKYRPDEEYLVSRAVTVHHGEFNPHFFIYPGLSIYLLSFGLLLLRIWDWLTGCFGGLDFFNYLAHTLYAPAHLCGRVLAAIYGTASIYALWLLGRQANNKTIALGAAFLLALNFSHVRESHFATSDTLTVLLSTLALWQFCRLGKYASLRHYAASGVFFGLAVAAKYPAVVLLFPLMVAHLQGVRNAGKSCFSLKTISLLTFCGFCSFASFFIASPYVLLDYAGFIKNWQFQSGFLSGGISSGGPVGWRWLFLLALPYGAGTAVSVLAFAGIVVMLWRGSVDFNKYGSGIILAVFLLAQTAIFLPSNLVYFRYVVLLIPVICLAASSFVFDAVGCLKLSYLQNRALIACFLLAISFNSLYRVMNFDSLLNGQDTRNFALAWLQDNVPANATILTHSDYYYGKPDIGSRYKYLPFSRAIGGEYSGEKFDFMMVDEYPYPLFSPTLSGMAKRFLDEKGEKIVEFSPFVAQTPVMVLDLYDAFYAPIDGFAGLNMAGPRISLYRLKESPYSWQLRELGK